MTAEPAVDPNRYRVEAEFQGDYIIHAKPGTPVGEEQPCDTESMAMVEGRWTSGEVIGSGGFATVLKQNNEDGKLRAVKRLNRGALGTKEVKLSWELRILAYLKDYPKLFVRFFGWFESKIDIFFVMEYIDNGDLNQYLRRFPEEVKIQSREITRQLLEGLVIMHGQNICHRDLKPQNILIAKTSPIHIKIADFGVSKQERGTQLKTNCGTECYKAPELRGFLQTNPRRRRRKGSYTNAVDLWSLGTVVHVILTSELPFLSKYPDEYEDGDNSVDRTEYTDDSAWEDEQDQELLNAYCSNLVPFPTESLERAQIDSYGIDLVEKLLSPEPQNRPSAKEVLRSLWIECHQRFNSHFNSLNIRSLRVDGDIQSILFHALETLNPENTVESLCELGCPRNIAIDLSVLACYDIDLFGEGPAVYGHRGSRPTSTTHKLEEVLYNLKTSIFTTHHLFIYNQPNSLISKDFHPYLKRMKTYERGHNGKLQMERSPDPAETALLMELIKEMERRSITRSEYCVSKLTICKGSDADISASNCIRTSPYGESLKIMENFNCLYAGKETSSEQMLLDKLTKLPFVEHNHPDSDPSQLRTDQQISDESWTIMANILLGVTKPETNPL